MTHRAYLSTEVTSNAATYFKEPIACTEGERGEFARLVREGFEGSDEGLPGRIRAAKWLAFHYAAGGTLAAIAGLKVRDERYRDDVFEQARARVTSADYKLELGWVYVVPAHRGKRIAEGLCEQLLAREPASSVFATTRPDNASMMRILHALGFARVGQPFPQRNEELVLFLRPCRKSVMPGKNCPACGSDMRSRSLWSGLSLKPYQVCPDCSAKYTSDSKSKRRQVPIMVLALTTLGLSIAVTLRGSDWLLPAAGSHIALWVYVGYAVSKATYVRYHD